MYCYSGGRNWSFTESLTNSELTCKAWKAPICDSHLAKHRNMLFQQKVKQTLNVYFKGNLDWPWDISVHWKIASSPLFKRFHINFDQSSCKQCSRKLLDKYQYAYEVIRVAFLLCDRLFRSSLNPKITDSS